MDNFKRASLSVTRARAALVKSLIDAASPRRELHKKEFLILTEEINEWIIFDDGTINEEAKDLQSRLNSIKGGHQYSGLRWKDTAVNTLIKLGQGKEAKDAEKDDLKKFLNLFVTYLKTLAG